MLKFYLRIMQSLWVMEIRFLKLYILLRVFVPRSTKRNWK
jgi:hypothetical protein